jgi:hypothetical protein
MYGKLRHRPKTFIIQGALNLMLSMTFGPANNINNQQPTMSKTSHQINGWPPTIFLVNQSIVLNFSL